MWDFTTSQANGTIGSLALTMAENSFNYSDPYNITWQQGTMHNPYINNTGNFDMYPLCYDSKMGYLYYTEPQNSNWTSRYDSVEKVTYYISTFKIMKQYIPSRVYGIADKINRYIDAEKVAEFSIEMKKKFGLYQYLYPGYDGFAYLINPIDESAEYWKVKTSDHSFELSEKITIDLKGCKLKQELGKAVISKGVAYITAEDSKSLYIVNLANQVDIIQVTIPDEYYVNTQLIALNNGGVKFGVTSNNSYRGAFCYPDGKIILQGEKILAKILKDLLRGQN